MLLHILTFLSFLLLASCASKIPRAILPPQTKVERIDTQGIEQASKATRQAVREIAAAGNETRSVTAKLRAEIDRAEILAAANEELVMAFANIQAFAEELSTALKLSDSKTATAIEVIDLQDERIKSLSIKAAMQKIQIESNDREKETLRNQIEELMSSSDRLAIAEDKLGWWRWAAMITWGVIAFYVGARIFLKAAIPFAF